MVPLTHAARCWDILVRYLAGVLAGTREASLRTGMGTHLDRRAERHACSRKQKTTLQSLRAMLSIFVRIKRNLREVAEKVAGSGQARLQSPLWGH